MAAVHQIIASPSPNPDPTTSFADNSDSFKVDIGNGNHAEHASQSPPVIDSGFFGDSLQGGDSRIIAIIYGKGQEPIVSLFGEVLGRPSKLKSNITDVTTADQQSVIGIPAAAAQSNIATRDHSMVVTINAHLVNLGMPPNLYLSEHCDYEFLYSDTPDLRRDLCRFTAFILGQINHHSELMAKPRTLFISTTFPDVRAALPNLDILTVGSDAVELRVDLLREPLGGGSFAAVPSLKYVGEQVMLLRQRTELPIIFTTRCTNENGRFPMDNPKLYHEYLYRAIQWGVEYIDVELWLPEDIRQDLWHKKGNSRIMSAFHDFSGNFKWPSIYAQEVFERSIDYADIIKMIAIINDHTENFELEYFRSKVKTKYPHAPPFSAVNMGQVGQFSRSLNKTFTPITHPLLPLIAAPGQLSAAEINSALAHMGHLPKKSFYGITSVESRVKGHRAPFYEKCFNELGLPHQFAVIERQPNSAAGLETLCSQRSFGGAYLDPGLSYNSIMKHNPLLATANNGEGPIVSEAARVIGTVDTIVARVGSLSHSISRPSSIPASPRQQSEGAVALSQVDPNQATTLVFDNASWKGILSALTRDLAPSAYAGRTAMVLASSSDDAAPVIFAMKALKIAKIYTLGFKTSTTLARNAPPIEQFNSLESLQRARSGSHESAAPFVMVSALGPAKSSIVRLLLRAFASNAQNSGSTSCKKVFLDMAHAADRQAIETAEIAEKSGFAAYGAADSAAFTTVESLRLLVGQNIQYSFVRLASGN
ncbi:pentafunctional AROM polypeptide [Cordyceps militaris CM01]|uniref:Pentafunctional AROM polypeptide n=1 Tax=Cordyceps militaris (strain CM01) TaxID=983644 RepID=G3JRA4_CORMM|nr:pentafunctional AROM polypeptide [Cordyceps militaris CM01]EGX88400.1 pentafunctional AROM polypeptide [Cordyceps militaris CM01]